MPHKNPHRKRDYHREYDRKRKIHSKTHLAAINRAGQVRGLLCWTCNTMLGYARDSILVLSSAINYLKQQETNNE